MGWARGSDAQASYLYLGSRPGSKTAYLIMFALTKGAGGGHSHRGAKMLVGSGRDADLGDKWGGHPISFKRATRSAPTGTFVAGGVRTVLTVSSRTGHTGTGFCWMGFELCQLQ